MRHLVTTAVEPGRRAKAARWPRGIARGVALGLTLAVTAGLAGCPAKATNPGATGLRDAPPVKLGPNPLGLAELPPITDAPYELADDRDLRDERARFDAMIIDAPGRDALRVALAAEYARRIRAALDAGSRDGDIAAHAALQSLVGLWTPAEIDGRPGAGRGAGAGRTALRAQLPPHLPLIEELRRRFARSAREAEVTLALVVLAATSPDGARYERELDEVFAFSDALNVSQYGEGAERARPIELLEAAVQAFPSRLVVDRLVSLHAERQRAMHARFRTHGADVELIRAHGQSLAYATWLVARALARADRIDEIYPRIKSLQGIGDDPDLRERVRLATSNGGPGNWMALAASFRAGDRMTDHHAALNILRAGIAAHPDDTALWVQMATVARELENLPMAIAMLERAVALSPDDRDAAGRLAELYRIRISSLALGERPLAAEEALHALEAFYARAAEKWPDRPFELGPAEAYAAMGQGLLNLGHLAAAERYLERSVELRATFDALEALGTMALKQDRFDAATGWFDRALAMGMRNGNDQVSRAKILRLAGDARQGAGDRREARRLWLESLATWAQIADAFELPNSLKAELLIETGKAQWSLGDRDTALTAFDLAVDLDPDSPATHAAVVAFLIVRDEYDRALDTYHRALASAKVSDYFKVYMSLWVLAEARRSGVREDPFALEYLAGRDGRLWYDDLARLASGRSAARALRDSATTRGRRAELLYYAAVLSRDSYQPSELRSFLQSVLATDMVMFFEYDMAKHWLSRGFRPAAAARSEQAR